MDSSSSIQVKPTEYKKPEQIKSFGKIKKLIKGKDYLTFQYENGNLLVAFYQNIIRLNFYHADKMTLDSDIILLPRQQNYQVDNQQDNYMVGYKDYLVKVSTAIVQIFYQEQEIFTAPIPNFVDDRLTIKVKTKPDVRYFGFGEKPGQVLNKKGTKTSNWATDIYAPHCEINQEMYTAINFSILNYHFNSNKGIFVDNPSRVFYDMTNDNEFKIAVDQNSLDLYFIGGLTIKDIITNYTNLTGKPFLPPKWALGHHQSRHTYQNENEFLKIIENYHKFNLPLSAIYLDILYMDRYRVFTFDQERFPNIKKIIAQLIDKKINTVPIVDPGIAIAEDNQVYNDGCKKDMFVYRDKTRTEYETGEVWPGNCVFPDLFNPKVQKWWGELHKFYTDLGITGIWNDMNEPAVFNAAKTISGDAVHQTTTGLQLHKEVHNKYGFYTSVATYHGLKTLLAKANLRPFLITRSAYAGSQKYATVWTGDNFSYWWQLKQTIPMCLNLSLSGFNMIGTDIGGFAGDSNGALLTRWYQANIFFPFLRNHAAFEAVNQEPWAFGDKYLQIIKKYLYLRYQFLPTIYSLAFEAHQTGIGSIRPLFLEYGDDVETYKISDEYLLGDNILVAPILEQEQTQRLVYLPQGNWYDYWTKTVYQGQQWIIVQADLTQLPIFVKSNSIIMKTNEQQKDVDYQNVNIYVYLDSNINKDITAQYYNDDGKTYAYLDDKATKLTIKYHDDKVFLIAKNQLLATNEQFRAYTIKNEGTSEIPVEWVFEKNEK
ncbi:glycoside hydrolase family 31 protein [Spiroplasma sp. SV19]|uniref:glycoside hydrolase family 31 protein n=1 Tax=Spiroplasma sp. SV19 TaxID=2570468 RepID=UPI0024B772F2|nr:glycoside hydrolase family 31 protein [Spiroplasma sp. SV19]WHQ37353.1 alpha-glucosidase [Spiroplasma sp. SV19]